MAGDVHCVMQNPEHFDTAFGLVQDVQKEMARGPAALRNMEEPPVIGQPLPMMTEVRMLLEALAGFRDQRAVLRYLDRPELPASSPENLAYVRFGNVAEDQTHGYRNASASASSRNASNSSSDSSCGPCWRSEARPSSPAWRRA